MIKHYQVRILYPLIGTIISAILFIFYQNNGFNWSLALFTTILGLIIWWMATITLGRSFALVPKAGGLIQNGIYSKIRHPIYLGFSLAGIGWAILTRSDLLILLVVGIILSSVIRASLEEKKLIKTFGEKYAAYKKQSWF